MEARLKTTTEKLLESTVRSIESEFFKKRFEELSELIQTLEMDKRALYDENDRLNIRLDKQVFEIVQLKDYIASIDDEKLFIMKLAEVIFKFFQIFNI